jgi:hypothetical protein
VVENEAEMILRLIGKLAAAFGIVMILMASAMGGGFLFLVGANAGQEEKFANTLNEKADKEMFIAYTADNERDHTTLRETQIVQGGDISDIKEGVAEIRANVKILLDERIR